MTSELRVKFKEIAEFIYGDDKIAMEIAMEYCETDGDLYICFDDYSEFEARLAKVEEFCWAWGFIIEREGGGYIVKADET